MNRRVVLTTDEEGIYLGSFLGLGIWSKLDPAGQEMATTFASVEDAKEFIATWDSSDDIKDRVKFVWADIEDDSYISLKEVEAHPDLEAWDLSS